MAQRNILPEDRAEVQKHVGILRDFAPAAGITVKSVVPLFDKGMTGYTLDPLVSQALRDQIATMRRSVKFGDRTTPSPKFELPRNVTLSLKFFHVIPENEAPVPEGPPRTLPVEETTTRDLTTLGPEAETNATADRVPESEKPEQKKAATRAQKTAAKKAPTKAASKK